MVRSPPLYWVPPAEELPYTPEPQCHRAETHENTLPRQGYGRSLSTQCVKKEDWGPWCLSLALSWEWQGLQTDFYGCDVFLFVGMNCCCSYYHSTMISYLLFFSSLITSLIRYFCCLDSRESTAIAGAQSARPFRTPRSRYCCLFDHCSCSGREECLVYCTTRQWCGSTGETDLHGQCGQYPPAGAVDSPREKGNDCYQAWWAEIYSYYYVFNML